MNLPKYPIILLSFVNTQLRDNYPSLTELAKTAGVEEAEITDKLKAVGYTYDADKNQFIR